MAASGPPRSPPPKLRLSCSVREGRKPSACGSSRQFPLRTAIKSQFFWRPARNPARARRHPRVPADMDTVEANDEDVPRDLVCHVDSAGNTYDFGFGLN